MGKAVDTVQEDFIQIKGARVHNLKNIDLNISRDKLVVITGVSGSGKSSLAFDTIYAEGQRRYVESLSSYARQFLGRMNKPEVDYIRGIPPAIAVEQKVNTRNPRSTVGTSTEIYDYIKLLFARIGETYSPVSGKLVTRDTVSSVIDYISEYDTGTKVAILSPLKKEGNISLKDRLEAYLLEGFSRVEYKGEFFRIKDFLEDTGRIDKLDLVHLVIDRIKVQTDADAISRWGDSLQLAFKESNGQCILMILKDEKTDYQTFSDRYELDGIEFEEPSVHMFSFNNPIGACPRCEGYGKIIGIDEDLVIPNKSLSIYENAIICWKGEKMSKWRDQLIYNADKFDFPVHKPYYDLTNDQKRLLWTGNRYFKGLNAFFAHLEEKKYKIQYRVMLSRYRGKTTCTECNGTRLRNDTSYIYAGGKNIQEIVNMPLLELADFFNVLKLDDYQEEVAGRILFEIRSRLRFMNDVGLGYLTLHRLSSTLSGGESQRINLATSLGSSLVGSLYILDEPSIGLHPRDTKRLISVLKRLRDLGNTVIVVEHDEEIIRSADQLIDIGPGAGRLGGEIIFSGDHRKLSTQSKTLTAKYINDEMRIEVPEIRRISASYILMKGARQHNLKSIDVKIPLNIMTVITGISGSGKTTLIKSILFPALNKRFNGTGEKTGEHDRIEGDIDRLSNVEFVDQNPIGRSSRSNPVTYLKAYDEIRKLFAAQQAAKINDFKPAHFSFNVDGGRCEECQGEGEITVEMQFMADVHLVCESCNGKRFKDDVLQVKYKDKNIFDVLEMTVDEAIVFFTEKKSNASQRKIVERLKPLSDVGLGYVKLGQSSSTLSGGESQRVKLASFLVKESSEKPKLFIFDEPTTGLHFHDINKLLSAFNALIDKGNTVLVIEHNPDIIKCADWIIDLGPEGGDYGGEVVFEGTPENLIKNNKSYTAKFIRDKL